MEVCNGSVQWKCAMEIRISTQRKWLTLMGFRRNRLQCDLISTFQMWQYHLSTTCSQTERQHIDLPKRHVGDTCLSSYMVCTRSVLNMIGLYTTEIKLANSKSLREAANSLAHLYDTNMHSLYTYLWGM